MYALRSWGSGVQAFAIETGSLPPKSGPIDKALFSYLYPTYHNETEVRDYWFHTLDYAVSPDGTQYQLISRGFKGEPDFPPGWVEIERATTSCWEDDIILQMPRPKRGQPNPEIGEFVRSPAGPQRGCTLEGWAGFWTRP